MDDLWGNLLRIVSTTGIGAFAAAIIAAIVPALLQLYRARQESAKLFAQESAKQAELYRVLAAESGAESSLELRKAIDSVWLRRAQGEFQSPLDIDVVWDKLDAAIKEQKAQSPIALLASDSGTWPLSYVETDDTTPLLKAYFRSNLSHVGIIFWASLVSMLAGLGIIAISLVIPHPFQTPAVIGGVVSQFIAATFLVVYRSAVAQATEFAKTLERMRRSNFDVIVKARTIQTSLSLLDQVSDDEASFRNRTIAATVATLLGRSAADATAVEPRNVPGMGDSATSQKPAGDSASS